MKIHLSHLGYTVTVRKFKPNPTIPNALAYVKNDDAHNCSIYLDSSRKIGAGDLAHELVHVLQFICLNRNINFTLEHEHMGYIMHYLMGKIQGYEYDIPVDNAARRRKRR